MKIKPFFPLFTFAGLAILVAAGALVVAQTPKDAPKPMDKLTSAVYAWDNMTVEPKANGERRFVFDGPTTALDKLHCHISTLNPGERSGEPRLHLQEEVIIVKEGTIEATFDGETRIAPAGSVIYFNARAVTALRNAGDTPATYFVLYYYTPLTPTE
jgi:mannose-6-phosphate isomerase-like protein (cupin superfamily)